MVEEGWAQCQLDDNNTSARGWKRHLCLTTTTVTRVSVELVSCLLCQSARVGTETHDEDNSSIERWPRTVRRWWLMEGWESDVRSLSHSLRLRDEGWLPDSVSVWEREKREKAPRANANDKENWLWKARADEKETRQFDWQPHSSSLHSQKLQLLPNTDWQAERDTDCRESMTDSREPQIRLQHTELLLTFLFPSRSWFFEFLFFPSCSKSSLPFLPAEQTREEENRTRMGGISPFQMVKWMLPFERQSTRNQDQLYLAFLFLCFSPRSTTTINRLNPSQFWPHFLMTVYVS